MSSDYYKNNLSFLRHLQNDQPSISLFFLHIKVGLSCLHKNLFYLLPWKPSKMMKNAFYFILTDSFC